MCLQSLHSRIYWKSRSQEAIFYLKIKPIRQIFEYIMLLRLRSDYYADFTIINFPQFHSRQSQCRFQKSAKILISQTCKDYVWKLETQSQEGLLLITIKCFAGYCRLYFLFSLNVVMVYLASGDPLGLISDGLHSTAHADALHTQQTLHIKHNTHVNTT